jgi:bifunctional N-acetylglucosamine-1-phosphate-uridyltransferase/glucosamine-1-phosphate-acetyltransferase GlmU-like protein
MVLQSCAGVQTQGPASVLDVTDDLYEDIKIIVTDPDIKPLFSQATLERLQGLEEDYLEAKEVLKGYPEDAEALERLMYISEEILAIIGDNKAEKLRPYIAGIRVSIQILRRHLPDYAPQNAQNTP